MARSVCSTKEESSPISDLICLHLKKPDNEQRKPKQAKEIKNKKQKAMQLQREKNRKSMGKWFFEKLDTNDEPLAGLSRTEKGDTNCQYHKWKRGVY